MGRQIIKQPNGKYCIFNSEIDNVTDYNMSVDDIIEEWTNEAKKETVEKVKNIVAKLENNEQPYYQFTKSFDDMLVIIKEIHGKKEMDEIKSLIENSHSQDVLDKVIKTEEEASKYACKILREHFVGLDHANIVAAGDGIGPYDDAYIIRNFPFEWGLFMDGWKFACGNVM